MAEAVKPTNEQIVEMLDQIMRELSEMKDGQKELSTKLANSIER